jgi:hypothetical protein
MDSGRLGQIVASDSRAKRVNFDWIELGRKIRVRIDQDQARLLGLSSESIAAKMNTVMLGAAVTQVRDGIYLIDVLGVFAALDFEQEYPLIWRGHARDNRTAPVVIHPPRCDTTSAGSLRSVTKLLLPL